MKAAFENPMISLPESLSVYEAVIDREEKSVVPLLEAAMQAQFGQPVDIAIAASRL